MVEVRLSVSLPLLLAASAAAAYVTKPEEDSFKPFLKQWLQGEIKRKRNAQRNDESSVFSVARWVGEAGDNLLTTVLSHFSTPTFRDYQVCRIARLRSRGRDFYFFGIYGRWIALCSFQKLLDQYESS